MVEINSPYVKTNHITKSFLNPKHLYYPKKQQPPLPSSSENSEEKIEISKENSHLKEKNPRTNLQSRFIIRHSSKKRQIPNISLTSSLQKPTKLIRTPYYKNFTPKNYKYIFEPGNNHDMTKEVLSQRSWWSEAGRGESSNFIWWQTNYGLNYNKFSKFSYEKRLTNNFEYCTQITCKDRLFKNLTRYLQVKFFYKRNIKKMFLIFLL